MSRTLVIYLLFISFVYICSVGVRLHQHMYIMESPAHTSGSDVILTTHDGYRWLRFAKEHQMGGYESGREKLVLADSLKPPELPLISLFTAEFSDISGLPLEISGSLLTVFLSGLFVFPLGLFFYLIGYPSAGVGACLLGSLSISYLGRTSAFQIDTDMLNLFFLSAGVLLVYLAGKGRSVFWSVLLGLTMYTFWRWYFHSGFTVVYFILLVFALRKCDVRTFGVSAAAYIVLSNPAVFISGFSGLFEFSSKAVSASDVAELTVYPFFDSLKLLTPFWWLSLAGLSLSFLLKQRVIFLSVFYMLGLLMFFKGHRYGMFLAPVCGAGIGIIFDYGLRGRRALSYAALVGLFVLVILQEEIRFIPKPICSAETYKEMKNLNKISDDAIIASLWDSGFILQYLTEKKVLADGASQFKAAGKIFADTVFKRDEQESAEILIENSRGEDVYLMFTPDIDKKLPSLLKAADYLTYIEDGGVYLTNSEHGLNDKKLKLSETLYFRLHVIGLRDIRCFKRISEESQLFSLYKVEPDCLKR